MQYKKRQEPGLKLGRIGNRPYWVYLLSILIRALHLLGVAAIVGYLLYGDAAFPMGYLLLTSLSGLFLIATEWLRHRQLVREVCGLITLVKLLVLGAAFHGLLPLEATVMAAFLLAAVGAHAPKEFRHRLLL